jgi:hypothetical protein
MISYYASAKGCRFLALCMFVGVLVIFISLCILTNGFTPKNWDVSESQVVEAGLYGYIFPESYVKQAGWQQHIRMLSLPLDCRNNYIWRRVRTFYTDSSGEAHFYIDVSPSHERWSQDQSTKIIPLTLNWAKGSAVEAQSDQWGTSIRIKDVRGMNITIRSDSGLTDTLSGLAKLRPFGESVPANINLWKTECYAS